MKAAWIEEFGDVDVIQVGERPIPERKSDEVLVRVKASTLNHHDIYLRRGEAGRIRLPVILGSDGSGVVVEADSSSTFQAGQHVVIYPVLSCGDCANCRSSLPHKCCRSFGMIGGERNGTQAEYVAVPETCLVAMPAHLDFVSAASISLAGLTAWNMVVDEGQVTAGMHTLVMGASGGVGVFIVRLLKMFGAHVHAVTSSSEKRQSLLELGVDSVILDSPSDVLSFTRALPDGGVDLAFNFVGGNTWRYIPPATKSGGRILVCGTVRSPFAEIDMRQIFYRNLSIDGCSMGTPDSLRRLLSIAAKNQDFRIPIDRTIELSNIANGHAALEHAEVVGKIVVLT